MSPAHFHIRTCLTTTTCTCQFSSLVSFNTVFVYNTRMVTTRRGARLKDEASHGEDKKKRTNPGIESDTEQLVEEIFLKMKGSSGYSPNAQSSSDGTICKEQSDVLQLDSPSHQSPSTCPTELASSLQPHLDESIYFSYDPVKAKDTDASKQKRTLCHNEVDSLLKKSVITSDFEKKECAPPINRSRYSLEKSRKTARLQSAGKGWFDLPAPHLTPELKNDLKLLRMRNALDPSRHYKSNDSKQLPRYFQVGRVVSDASEFYSSRIPRKQRKQSLVEELLSNEATRSYHKKKYLELQSKFSSGTRRLKSIRDRKKYRAA